MSQNNVRMDTYPPEWPFLEDKISISVECSVNFSESKEKVSQAIHNLLPELQLKSDSQNNLTGYSTDINVLANFFENIFEQKILDVARRCAIEGVETSNDSLQPNKIILYLNKQIALINKVNFSNPSESPLGPIIITIEFQKIDEFIDQYFPKFEWFIQKKTKL